MTASVPVALAIEPATERRDAFQIAAPEYRMRETGVRRSGDANLLSPGDSAQNLKGTAKRSSLNLSLFSSAPSIFFWLNRGTSASGD